MTEMVQCYFYTMEIVGHRPDLKYTVPTWQPAFHVVGYHCAGLPFFCTIP